MKLSILCIGFGMARITGSVARLVAFNSLYWIHELLRLMRCSEVFVSFNSLYWIRATSRTQQLTPSIRFQFFVLDSPHRIHGFSGRSTCCLSILCIGFREFYAHIDKLANKQLSILCIGFGAGDLSYRLESIVNTFNSLYWILELIYLNPFIEIFVVTFNSLYWIRSERLLWMAEELEKIFQFFVLDSMLDP